MSRVNAGEPTIFKRLLMAENKMVGIFLKAHL